MPLLERAAHAPDAAGQIIGALDEPARGALRRASRSARAEVDARTARLCLRAGAARLPAGGGLPPSLARAAAAMPALRHFDLEAPGGGAAFPADGLAALFGATRWPALAALRLAGAFADADVAALAARGPPNLPALRSLDLDLDALEPAGAAAAALQTAVWQLEELAARGGAAAAAAAPALRGRLRRLTLRSGSAEALAVVSAAPCAGALEALAVEGGELAGGALEAAIYLLAARAPRLRGLTLACCALDSPGLDALASARWPALRSLRLGVDACFDGAPSCGALNAERAFARMPRLEELEIVGVFCPAAGAALLARRRWPRLRALALRGACMAAGDPGAGALSRGAWPALERLDLRPRWLAGPPPPRGAALTLAGARAWAPALRELEQGGDG
jgi:hypothetical protein